MPCSFYLNLGDILSLLLAFVFLAGNPKFLTTPVTRLDIEIDPADLYGMAVDEKGQVYASALLMPLIFAFGPDGEKRPSLGSAGRGPGELQYPMALTYAEGYLYTIDNGRRLLYKINPETGVVEKEWSMNQANAISVKDNNVLVAFNAPRNGRMFGVAALSDKLDFGGFLYEEGCCLDVQGAKQGGLCFDGEGGVWLAYSGEYSLVHMKGGKVLKKVEKAPEGYVVPSPLTKTSRFDRKAESKHYTSFDKIRGVFQVKDYVFVYRNKSLANGSIDVYRRNGEFVFSQAMNNIVPFQAGADFFYAYMVDENDNISLVKIYFSEA